MPRRVSAPDIEAVFVVKAEVKRLVELAVVEKKLVVVALVPVAVTKVKFWKVEEALARMLLKVPVPLTVNVPPVPVVKNRFVEDAVVEKKLVVVAFVEVELRKVIFWNVEEAVAKILAEVRRVVEVMFAKVGDAVVLTDWSNQSLRVGAPFTVNTLPLTVRLDENRLVELAVVLKKFVVVADVPVAVVNCNVWTVVEALASKPPVTVIRSLDASPRKVWSWTVRLPATVVSPCEVEPVRTRLLP